MRKSGSLSESFSHALDGFIYCLKTERNIRIHLAMGFIALVLGIILAISPLEFVVLFLLIGMVIVSEMVNTAVENVVDIITQDYHHKAKIVKDITAGAVLLACAVALCVGCIIFIPYIIAVFN